MSKALEAAVLGIKLADTINAEEAHPSRANRIAQDALKLMRLSASLRGIHVHECNGTMAKCPRCKGTGSTVVVIEAECPDCSGSGNDERRERRLCKAITETLAPYGLTWHHNTDPRGAAVGILFPNGSYNTMGGKEEGWRI